MPKPEPSPLPAYSRRGVLALAGILPLAACSATLPTILPGAEVQPEQLTTAQILEAINGVRRANGRPDWSYSASLARAAKSHADLMAARGQLSHDLGITLRERVTAAGYQGAVGENLAAGQRSISQVILDWLASPGHRGTLLSDRFVEFGFAVTRAPQASGSAPRFYWAMIAGGSFAAWQIA